LRWGRHWQNSRCVRAQQVVCKLGEMGKSRTPARNVKEKGWDAVRSFTPGTFPSFSFFFYFDNLSILLHGSPSYFCLHTPVRASAKASHRNDAAAVAAAATAADIFIPFDVELIPYKYSSMRTHACLRDTRTSCALLVLRFESRMIFCLSSRICGLRVDNDKFKTTRQLSVCF